SADYRVEWTPAGSQALERIGHGDVDVCLLDYRLGGEDGIEVLRAIAAMPQHPAVLITTGQGNERIDREALALGASDYLVKQELSGRMLDRSIRYAMGQRRMLLALSER